MIRTCLLIFLNIINSSEKPAEVVNIYSKPNDLTYTKSIYLDRDQDSELTVVEYNYMGYNVPWNKASWNFVEYCSVGNRKYPVYRRHKVVRK